MIFMLMFSGTKHKYVIQVYKYKVSNILSHDTIYQPLRRLMGHFTVLVAIQYTQINHI